MADGKIRVRWGLRGFIPFLPNACVIVRPLSLDHYQKLAGATVVLQGVFTAIGWSDIAAKLFCEAS